jgi:threonine dehydratase
MTARIVDHDNPRPTMESVHAARERLRGVAVHTPLLRLHEVDGIWLKPETLQPTGSFKVRGIYNAVAALSDAERAKGVSIVSSGNAAQALAWSARRFGIPARAIMPRNAPQAKVQSFIALGGKPELREPERAFDMLLDRSYMAEPDTFIHPTANPDVVAGFGAIALEILEDLPDVEEVWVPVGGGGLISGIANVLRELAPHVRVVGVQPATCTPIIQGVEAGEPVITACETFCDGVAGTFMDPDTWPLLRDLRPDWATTSEEAVLATIRRLALGNKLVEGSGALSVAAALSESKPRTRVCILSGGSIDPDKLAGILMNGVA